MANDLATYRFGPYELRTQSRELFKLGTKIRLRPQSYQVLQLLVERAGDAVSREELHSVLWPAAMVNDFELGLNTCIKELRGVLSDSATEPRYIQTLPKVGYRMLRSVTIEPPAEVTEAAPNSAESVTEESPRSASEPDPRRSTAATWKWAVAAVLALLLIAGTFAYLRWSSARQRATASTARTMLAVLPFENLTGDPTQDYFSDGLTEEMITQLGRLDPQHLGLIARTSAMHYKNDRKGLAEISKELGVQYVLQGSVRRDAGNVRITAELIQAKDQTHIWSEEYDRQLSNLLTVQSEIAQQIAREIKLTLRGEPSAPPAAVLSPSSYQAYDLYLEGRYFWNKRTAQSLQRAAEYFQQSIDKDPNYARSYAGLADSYAMMSSYDVLPPEAAMPEARAAAQSAIKLDDGLAEAHVSLAVIAQNYDWDWNTAEKEYRRAIELDPNYATAHHWYAEELALTGKFDEAFGEIERARQLDPLSLIIAADRGAILYFSRQYAPAVAQFNSVLEMEPNFLRAHLVIFAYTQQGDYANASAALDRARKTNESAWSPALEIYLLGRSGKLPEARQHLEKFKNMNWPPSQVAVPMAVAYIGTGENTQAVAWLEKAYAVHSASLTAIKVDPTYDPLRSDPRFKDLLRRVGLAP
jgi:TolB-like protein/DNA-binding winged helix-turn-helix (wHTH) protein/Tfp pilus assembly protein PilF